MAEFVLDASVVMAWCFEDEANIYADAVLDRLRENRALVPSIWPLEVANVLVAAERRKRITKAEGVHFIELLRQLPIQVDLSSEQRIFDAVLNLACEHTLSTYDAAYLDLAMQTGHQLATLDSALRQAAARSGLTIFLDN